MSSLGKILLIDDNPEALADALPAYGYELKIAKDGLEGLNIINENPDYFDIVILDVMMPKLDGWEVLKTIRSKPETDTLSVIMLTAIEGEEKQIIGLRYGADIYLNKPVRLPVLLAHIETILRRLKAQSKQTSVSNLTLEQTTSEEIKELSGREKELLKLVAEGKSNPEIAEILMIQETTVKSHIKNIFQKLNVSNRTQAAMIAVRLNLL
ncbi:MAG: response regulator transcription factor [Cyanobacteriota bacterium]